MSQVILEDQEIDLGERFLAALHARDFDRIQACFDAQVAFQALVPKGIRPGANAEEATGWLRRWFGEADEFQVLASSTDRVADRLHIAYRIRLHRYDGWQVIEQHSYCTIKDGLIETIRLLCSGFRPEPGHQPVELPGQRAAANGRSQRLQSQLGADALYDAGALGCAEGPMEEIAALMRQMASGQTLEVHASDPSVAGDLPAWCRMAGHEFVKQAGDRYLIRRK
jgi:TusA-related sulfurtransferase